MLFQAQGSWFAYILPSALVSRPLVVSANVPLINFYILSRRVGCKHRLRYILTTLSVTFYQGASTSSEGMSNGDGTSYSVLSHDR